MKKVKSYPGVDKLKEVETTLFIPLLIKAKDFDKKNPVINDRYPKSIVSMLNLNNNEYKINKYSAAVSLFRAKKFDSYVREYMNIHPGGLVVETGSGLDSRFYRVDNGKIRWINIDLPGVISLRKKIFGNNNRVTEMDTPLEKINWNSIYKKYPTPLFIAEEVLMYIERKEVIELLKKLGGIFHNSTMCFDIIPDFLAKSQSFKALKSHDVLFKWGLNKIEDLINQENGCKLIEEWRYFDKFEKRCGIANIFRLIPAINNLFKIIQIQFF
jgi:O-methyltransferase involved in polyketide biosynthesis